MNTLEEQLADSLNRLRWDVLTGTAQRRQEANERAAGTLASVNIPSDYKAPADEIRMMIATGHMPTREGVLLIKQISELRPLDSCPFCNDKARVVQTFEHQYPSSCRVVCKGCGASGQSFADILFDKGINWAGLPNAAKAWNNRHDR